MLRVMYPYAKGTALVVAVVSLRRVLCTRAGIANNYLNAMVCDWDEDKKKAASNEGLCVQMFINCSVTGHPITLVFICQIRRLLVSFFISCVPTEGRLHHAR